MLARRVYVVGFEQIGAKRVVRIRTHVGVRATNQPKCVGVARVAEIHGRIPAEEREWLARSELVPELLELMRGLEIAAGGKNVYHVAIDAKAVAPHGELPDETAHVVVEQIAIWNSIPQEAFQKAITIADCELA